MPIDITMPALSPTMETGTLAKWLVKEGDKVSPGDVIAEIETDKATMEVESIDEGTVARIVVAEGSEDVPVGELIAVLAEDGEEAGKIGASSKPATKAPEQKTPEQEPEKKAAAETGTPDKANGKDSRAAAKPDSRPAPKETASGVGRIKASPLARRLAEAKGIELSGLQGSGPGGRIVRADVLEAKGLRQAQPEREKRGAHPEPVEGRAPPSDAPYETIKLSNVRKVTARRLTESKQTVPHYYLTIDCNLDALLKLRAELNTSLEARGIKLSVNDVLVKALALALVEVPDANVQFAGDALYKFGRADISVAVALDGGLITPIIRDAAEKRLSTVAAEMKDLAGRAREGKLKPEEFQGGTASISNLGMYGIKQFDAVINPPQGLILAVGAGEKRPHVVDGALGVATVMTATGSFDHRAIEGATGAEFMAAFKRLVEAPMGMLA